MAAAAATSGRRATQRLSGFLSSLAQRGLRETATAFQLADVIGRPIEAVLAAIVNAIAPAGATLEEAAARRAVDDALCVLCEHLELQNGDLTKLDSIDVEVAWDVIRESIAAYIYNRWLQDVGDRIEAHAVSADSAVDLERQVRQFVTETVRLDFAGIDVLRFDWQSAGGRDMVEQIYRDAYSLLGE
jgi:hypothetical protein